MSFKRAIVRLSELVADKITGAIMQTAETGQRVVITPGIAGTGLVQFWTGAAGESAGFIEADPEPNPAIEMWSPTTPAHSGPAVVRLRSMPAGTNPQALIGGDLTTTGKVHAGADAAGGLGDIAADHDVTAVRNVVAGALVKGATLQATGAANVGTTLTAGALQALGPLTAGSLQVLGSPVIGLDFGTVTATTDASGGIVVPHGMGNAPKSVQVSPRQRDRIVHIFAVTATDFTVRFYDHLNTPVATTSVNFFWLTLA